MNTMIQKVQNGLMAQARDAYYAGLGVVATVEQEASTLYRNAERRLSGAASDAQANFDALAQQGRSLVTRSQKALKGEFNTLESEGQAVRADVAVYGDRVLNQAQDAVTAVLSRLGIPSRTEIQTLNANVEKLTAKVDHLRKQINA